MTVNDTPTRMQAIAAATRALSGRDDLQLQWNSNLLYGNPLNATKQIHLPPLPDNAAELQQLRGEADVAALALKYHNPKTHRLGRPDAPKAAAIFDALELVRVSTQGTEHLAGARQNLAARYNEWCELQGYGLLSPKDDAPMADILASMLREAQQGIAPPPALHMLVNEWRDWIEERAGDSLRKLSEGALSQQEFAKTVYELFSSLGVEGGGRGDKKGKSRMDNAANDDAQDSDVEQLEADDDMPSEARSSDEQSDERSDVVQKMPTPSQSDDLQPADQEIEDASHIPNHDPPVQAALKNRAYKVFTRKHDQIVMAHELATPDELHRLRAQLDQKLAQFHGVTSRLASRLQRLLMASRLRHWEFEQEEGMIDASRLPQVITSPDFPYYYKREQETDFKDTVVTLLLDNSGSMRGRPITVAALSADILARTLERCGVKVEILGFTTRDWKGGLSRKDWVAAGSPAFPGRLNDLRHIIYKSAEQRWQRGRRNLGLMLKDGILKENIDGEAILWAHDRLKARNEERKILMVISDGAPVDDSTLSVNNGAYLDLHLRDVIDSIENHSDVELLAIGIGHDVTRYYSRAVTLSDVDQLGDTMVRELTHLFSENDGSKSSF